MFRHKPLNTLFFLFIASFFFVQNVHALIAFVNDENIYTMNDNGLFVTQLTFERTDSSPDVSPDGTKIVFQKNNSIYVMNSDGSNVTQLTDSEKTDQYPVWNGDATKIAFESNRLVDYTYPHQITADGDNQTLFPDPLNYGSWHELAYNPNGERIALIFHELYHTSLNLWLAGTPGHDCNRAQIEGSYTDSSNNPDFSPSGELLVYTVSNTIYIRDNGGEEGSTRTQLSRKGTDPYFMSESRIVYVGDETLCMVDTDNSSFVDTGVSGTQPSWGAGNSSILRCPAETLFGEKSDEVALLRSFRDSVLTKTAIGRRIIDLYYASATAINEQIEKSPNTKKQLKEIMACIIALISLVKT